MSDPVTADGNTSIRSYPGGTVAVVHSGVMYWRPMFGQDQDWHPGAEIDAQGRAVLGINAMAARIGDSVVAIDPNTLTAADAPATAELVIGSPFRLALDAIQAAPDDVTHVLISHGHFDHFTGLTDPRDSGRLAFPNAEHAFPAADVPGKGMTGAHIGPVRDALALLAAAGRLRLTEGDVDVTPGVSILAAPGESAGHQVIRLTLGEEYVYYLGDLVHFPVEVEHPSWVALRNRDQPTLTASRHKVFNDPGPVPATFVFTHARFPGWGKIEGNGDQTYRWRFE